MAIQKTVLVQMHDEPDKHFITEVSVDEEWNSMEDYPEMFHYFASEAEYERAKQEGDNGYEFRILQEQEELTWEQVLHDVMFAIHNNRRDIK
jgi:predicted double-glycine peptidase